MSITIYSKRACPACEQVKAKLSALGITYGSVSIDTDLDAMDFIVAQGHRSVPQIYVGSALAIEGGWQGMSQLSNEEIVKRLT